MSQSQNKSQLRNPVTLLEAQQSALDMMSKLGALSFNFALDLHKTWFAWTQNQIMQYANGQNRLAHCRTTEEIFSVQSEMLAMATQDYKEGLSTQADLIRKTSQEYKERLDALAGAGETISVEASRAFEENQQSALSNLSQTDREMDRSEQEARNRGKAKGKTSRPEADVEDQAQRAH